MHELGGEVAARVATECRLLDALTAATPGDPGLVRGIGLILETLADSPFETLADYADGAAASSLFLTAFAPLAESVGDFLTVASLESFTKGARDRPERTAWSEGQQAGVRSLAQTILEKPIWPSVVKAAFDEPQQRFSAVRVAQRLGLPYRDQLIGWLHDEPLKAGWWALLCERPTAGQMDEVLALVDEILAIDTIRTGLGQELGIGPGFERNWCIDHIVYALRGATNVGDPSTSSGFPGRGETILDAALHCPVTRTRNGALAALDRWPNNALTPRLVASIEGLRADPVPATRSRAEELLAKLASGGRRSTD